MAWAWMSLTQSAPLNAPAKDSNYTYKDSIILLSDGLNTQNRWYSNASQIDARQKILCDNAKAASITIYTIQVNTGKPADPTSAVLQYCVSRSENFFMVTTSQPDCLSVQVDRNRAVETESRPLAGVSFVWFDQRCEGETNELRFWWTLRG